jgi:hypothetical protein
VQRSMLRIMELLQLIILGMKSVLDAHHNLFT